jgi:acetyl-CoA carboxylase biotin carboxylase subunit
MIAKLIVKGKNRQEAITRALRALSEFHIGGVKTTIPFHLDILRQKAFLDAEYDLGYVDSLIASGHKFGHFDTANQ